MMAGYWSGMYYSFQVFAAFRPPRRLPPAALVAVVGLATAFALAPASAVAQPGSGGTQPPPAVAQPPSRSLPVEDEFAIPRLDFLGRLLADAPSPERDRGWIVTPLLAVAEEYDSNIFGRSVAIESDLITRTSAGLSTSYVSDRLRLVASYKFDSEWYADHEELNDPVQAQLGGFDLRYAATGRATVGLSGLFSNSKGISQVLQVGAPGVELGRQEVTLLQVSPRFSYQLDPLTTTDLRYTYSLNDVEGSPTETRHEAGLAVTRQLTAVGRGTLIYEYSTVESQDRGSETSHVITPGYAHRLTPNATLSLELGPRFTEGDITLDVRAGFNYRFPSGAITVGYTRTEDIVVGLTGARTVDTVAALLEFTPLRPVRITVGSTVSWIGGSDEGDDGETTVYQANVAASYEITRWLLARLAYRYSVQENSVSVPRHVATLSLELPFPVRLR
jgi:hypothetical protein